MSEIDEKIEAFRADLEELRESTGGRYREAVADALFRLGKLIPAPPKIEPLSYWKLKGESGDEAYALVVGIDADGSVAKCWRRMSMDWEGLEVEHFREDYDPVTDPYEIERAKRWICEGKR